MQLAQLLGRQGRAEIPIAFANDRQRLGANSLGLALGCSGDRGASRSDPPHPRPGMPPKAGIPDAAQAQQLRRRRGRQPSLIQIPQHLEAAQAPDRSSAVPSPQTPPKNPPGSVISIWQRGDILIGRLQADVAYAGSGICQRERPERLPDTAHPAPKMLLTKWRACMC